MRYLMIALVAGSAITSPLLAGEDAPLFSDRRAYPVAAEDFRTAGVALGDVDGDGDLDLVEANGRHWAQPNYVYYNSDGRFTARVKLGALEVTSYTVDLADIDGDGDLDIVSASDRHANQVHLNDGKGHFGAPIWFGDSASATRSITVADVNGDGKPDIVTGNSDGQNRTYYQH